MYIYKYIYNINVIEINVHLRCSYTQTDRNIFNTLREALEAVKAKSRARTDMVGIPPKPDELTDNDDIDDDAIHQGPVEVSHGFFLSTHTCTIICKFYFRIFRGQLK